MTLNDLIRADYNVRAVLTDCDLTILNGLRRVNALILTMRLLGVMINEAR